jgi:hypothetical protein
MTTQTQRNILNFYCKVWAAELIPLRRYQKGFKTCKAPLLKGWQTNTHSCEEIETYLEKGHSIAWSLPSSILVVDVEVKTEDGHAIDGRESFKQLCEDFNIDPNDVPVVTSPKGGKHYIFSIPEGSSLRGKLDKYVGIDFLSKGKCVAVPPSRHWQGDGCYDLDSATLASGRQPPQAPDGLLQALLRPPRNQGQSITGQDESGLSVRPAWKQDELEGGIATPEEAGTLLRYLDPCDYPGNFEWFPLMVSVHHATGGQAGEEFEKWSWGDPKFRGDPSINTRWKSLDDRNNGITFGTFFKAVREKADEVGLKLLSVLETRSDFDVIEEDESAQQVVTVDVNISFDEFENANEVLSALTLCPDLFQRKGRLVRVTKQKQLDNGQRDIAGSLIIKEINEKALREMVAKRVRFFQEKLAKNSMIIRVPARCPTWLVPGLFSRGEWDNIRSIEGIVQTPSMLQDGFVLQEPGYNASYWLLYQPNRIFEPVPESPTHGDAVVALEELLEVVADFPFVSDAHRSVWLAAVLTVLARHSFRGVTPMFFFDGNSSGVGKSLLIDSVGLITTGRLVPKMSYPNSDEEMDKRLTTTIRHGTQIQLFDNVGNDRDFGFPSLDAAITAGTWNSRILGKSEMTGELRVHTLFIATGNNLRIGEESDAARRIAYCRIAYNGEDPSERSGFKHANLQEWIEQNQPRLVRAALTILRAYHVAGRPRQDIPTWGSFEKWSEAVRNPIVWIGEPDPLETKHALRELANEGAHDTKIVVHGWHEVSEGKPMTARAVFDRVQMWDGEVAFPIMHEAIETVLDPTRQRNFKSIGRCLRKYSDRSVGGIRLTKKRTKTSGQWVTVRSHD